MDGNDDDEQAGQAGEEAGAGSSRVPPPLEELLEIPRGDHQMLLTKNELAGMWGGYPKPFRTDYKRQDDGQAKGKKPGASISDDPRPMDGNDDDEQAGQAGEEAGAGSSRVPPPLEELLEIPLGDRQMLLTKNELAGMGGGYPKPFRTDYKRQDDGQAKGKKPGASIKSSCKMAESSTASQTVEQWLETQGFQRSENNTENNSQSLFKVVAAQQYPKLGSLYSYGIVKTDCVIYMAENQKLFDQDLDISFDDYQKKWYIDNDWPGQRQIQAMSLRYEKDFIVYDAMNKQRKLVTNNGYDKYFYLLQTTCAPNHYEIIKPINPVKDEGGDQMASAIINVSLNTLLKTPKRQGDAETVVETVEQSKMSGKNPLKKLRKD